MRIELRTYEVDEKTEVVEACVLVTTVSRVVDVDVLHLMSRNSLVNEKGMERKKKKLDVRMPKSRGTRRGR
jgi:hypothetical protein